MILERQANYEPRRNGNGCVFNGCGSLNLRGGVSDTNTAPKLYATIGAATNPSLTIVAITNE
jgi:hypothetical protein